MFTCRAAGVALLVLAVSGCGKPGGELAKPTEAVTWPALKALQDPEVARGILMTAQMGDIAGCKKNASDPKFGELVEKFTSEPIPPKFKTPARDAAKQKVVDAYKTLIAKAKDGSDAEVKTAVTDLTAAQTSLVDPNLK